jgi:SEC-C motif domain protein
MSNLCHCDSNKPFKQCCERFLSGKEVAKTPKQLMRSRYTAYSLGNHGEYLLKTWAAETSEGLTALSLSEKTYEWIKLEILDSEQKGNKGIVEFNACYKDEDDTFKVLHERSNFLRREGRWYYLEGEVNISIPQ